MPSKGEQMDSFMRAAIEEASRGVSEGGLPIGSVLRKGESIIGKGHNRGVKSKDPTAHAEIDCLRNAGIVGDYADTVLYTTMMPCPMCAGAVVFLGIKRVIAAESETFKGAREIMESRGVIVEDLNLEECKNMVTEFIKKHPDVWQENAGSH